jgi:hypothetical protein
MKRGFTAVQNILNLKVENVWGFKVYSMQAVVISHQ